MNDTNSEDHVDQFVTASVNILLTVTGEIGSKAHTMSQHMVSTIDSAENSTSKHMAALEASLLELRNELCTAHQVLSANPKHAMHTKRVAQMTQRNDEFERTLRRDHHEFSQMHARRLAHAFTASK
ncbi:hypothetical protein GGH96_000009 [Coemansia sp. RSA 1972]|nr:hypothetical protein GGH96_000009 [Coemansia sp. RSA 1972]